MFTIEAYVDGASSGNPGPSGYGAILIDVATGVKREISEPICRATGNMAELMAARGAMLSCKSPSTTDLTIYTDSQYTINVCSGKHKIKKNLYLIHTITDIMKMFNNVTWVHVRGHSGNVLNERADVLAKKAAQFAKNGWVVDGKPKVVGHINTQPHPEKRGNIPDRRKNLPDRRKNEV